MRKITAITNRVVVKRADAFDRTDKGIHIPLEAQEDMITGNVLSVGPLVEAVREGDIIYFGKRIGMDVGDNVLVMKEEDVLAVGA